MQPGFTEFGLAAWDSGKAIENLKQSDFSVTADGKTIPIAMFNGSSPAYSIVILVDTSGSMTPKIPWVREGIAHFIAKLPLQDDIALFAYSAHAYLLQPFTRNHALMQQRLALLHAYGQTATFDTIMQAIGVLNKESSNPKRAIVLITDGMDNASRSNAAEAGAALKKNDVSFFGIGIGDPSPSAGPSFSIGPFALPSYRDADRVDAKSLQSLADASGGKSFVVNTAGTDSATDDFSSALDQATMSLGTSYSIGVIQPTPIHPEDPVRFAIKDHPDAKIVTCEAARPTSPSVASAAQ
ncbi:MAG TPA: VWA domain-containing protein [Candidatus Binataceae bacterium]|nr:VWA domain-containing protein [Candidatus Binataceae bacterium]